MLVGMTRNETPLDRVQAQVATIRALVEKSGGEDRVTRIRRTFVQQGEQHDPRPGPLSAMIRAHDERALDLFLLHRMAAVRPPWDVTLHSAVWARGIGAPPQSGGVSVSRAFRRLDEKYRLVERTRHGHQSQVFALREDGHGEPYTRPAGTGGDVFFRLPPDYWLAEDRWFSTLPFAAKGMLLIALSLKSGFRLPFHEAPRWYGVSADTAERGLRILCDRGILRRKKFVRQDWLSPIERTVEIRYFHQPPFHRSAASSLQRRAGPDLPRRIAS